MNLHLINLEPEQWSRADWQEAYAKYCKDNMFGPKTKKEYYDMVLENFHKLAQQQKPLSDELSEQWLKGWRNAVAYARANKCDMNGCQTTSADDTRETREVASRAEEIAIDTMQRLDYIIESIRKWRS
jgi:hypothetical protein